MIVVCLTLARRKWGSLYFLTFSDISETQPLPIDRYQDAHTLAAKMQAVEVKLTRERLDSSCARLWPFIDF